MEMGWFAILNKNNTSISKSFTLITIPEVAIKIKLTDFEATKKWLLQKNITIHSDRKPYTVYEIDVDCELDKGYVRDLRNKYPDNWEEIYRKIAKDDAVCEMVVLSLSGEVKFKPLSKIKTINKSEDELLKRYMA
jgi:hypothetical protein